MFCTILISIVNKTFLFETIAP